MRLKTEYMNLEDLKQQKQDRVTALINECSMFFAFSNEQFNESKTPLKEGEKYLSLGAGCYMPKGNIDKWLSGTDEIDKWFKDAVRENKLRRANIEYELRNHEAGYTGEIDDTLSALGEDYTPEEVKQVLNEIEAD